MADELSSEVRHRSDVALGIGLAFILHALQLPLAFVTLMMALVFIGVSQLLYLIPAILIAKRKQRPGIVKGLIIGASVTFLLNAACFAIIDPRP